MALFKWIEKSSCRPVIYRCATRVRSAGQASAPDRVDMGQAISSVPAGADPRNPTVFSSLCGPNCGRKPVRILHPASRQRQTGHWRKTCRLRSAVPGDCQPCQTASCFRERREHDLRKVLRRPDRRCRVIAGWIDPGSLERLGSGWVSGLFARLRQPLKGLPQRPV